MDCCQMGVYFDRIEMVYIIFYIVTVTIDRTDLMWTKCNEVDRNISRNAKKKIMNSTQRKHISTKIGFIWSRIQLSQKSIFMP